MSDIELGKCNFCGGSNIPVSRLYVRTKNDTKKFSILWYCNRCEPEFSQNEMGYLKEELERERLRLVACGVAALSNTDESYNKQKLPDGSPYYSAAYQDVLDAVGREMNLKNQVESLTAENKNLNGLAQKQRELMKMMEPIDRDWKEMATVDKLRKEITEIESTLKQQKP